MSINPAASFVPVDLNGLHGKAKRLAREHNWKVAEAQREVAHLEAQRIAAEAEAVKQAHIAAEIEAAYAQYGEVAADSVATADKKFAASDRGRQRYAKGVANRVEYEKIVGEIELGIRNSRAAKHMRRAAKRETARIAQPVVRSCKVTLAEVFKNLGLDPCLAK